MCASSCLRVCILVPMCVHLSVCLCLSLSVSVCLCPFVRLSVCLCPSLLSVSLDLYPAALHHPCCPHDKVCVCVWGGGLTFLHGRYKQEHQFFKREAAKWRASWCHRTRALPHIKTFAAFRTGDRTLDWLLLGSHNLSKAAWGQLQVLVIATHKVACVCACVCDCVLCACVCL